LFTVSSSKGDSEMSDGLGENAASTALEQRRRVVGRPFPPGVSGNPLGRAPGSRNKFGEQFISDFLADWQEHGRAAIVQLRKESIRDYVRIAAQILPKELHVRADGLDEQSDEQLLATIGEIREALAQYRRSMDANPVLGAD
jgi:hypothetical protein